MARVLVCRTAWMDHYDGLRGGADKPRGGGAYVREQGFGHEIFNFRPDDDGRYRGYVRPPGYTMGSGSVAGQRLNINKLGAKAKDDRVTDVSVFWVATHPALGGTRVVGWYDNAIVFRQWRESPKPRLLPSGMDAGFMIEANTAHLVIPADDRVLEVPRATSKQTGIGQSNVWYPSDEWARQLFDYRERALRGKPLAPESQRSLSPGRMVDTEARLRIERAAMMETTRWCEARNLAWKDVSLKKLGWDIEAGEGRNILRIEVKGSSAPIGAALLELTPNEFDKMTSVEHRDSYRLAVVSVHGKTPSLMMFAWSHERAAWMAHGGAFSLRIDEVRSARVQVLAIGKGEERVTR